MDIFIFLHAVFSRVLQRSELYITKTCPCSIQKFLSAVKFENSIRKRNDFFFLIFLLKTFILGSR